MVLLIQVFALAVVVLMSFLAWAYCLVLSHLVVVSLAMAVVAFLLDLLVPLPLESQQLFPVVALNLLLLIVHVAE